jgi:hypothetical protein
VNERVPLHGHYLIVISGGPGTRATVACPDCGLRDASTDDVTDDGNAWVGARAPLDDFVRAVVLAGRALEPFADPPARG